MYFGWCWEWWDDDIDENDKIETVDFDFDNGDSMGHVGGVSGSLKYL